MREKGHHDLLSKTCCLTVPEKFEEETVRVFENSWNRKKLRIGERERERDRERQREREREREREKEGHHNFQPIQSVASE